LGDFALAEEADGSIKASSGIRCLVAVNTLVVVLDPALRQDIFEVEVGDVEQKN
jgi:hypothetical protein